MPAAKRAHITTLSILNTTIRQDALGRYCLNDCYKAAGSPAYKGPNEWAKIAQTEELIKELRSGGNLPDPKNTVTTGSNERRGTYVVRELVYAYAMWISPAFHLRVIRAFDAIMQGTVRHLSVDAAVAHRQAAGIFRSLNHVGKLTGMSREDAARAASAAAREHTGIDELGELPRGRRAAAAKNDSLVAVMATRPRKTLTEDDIAEGISCAIRVLSQLRTGSAQANIAEREQDLKMAGHAVMQMWDDVQRLKQAQQRIV